MAYIHSAPIGMYERGPVMQGGPVPMYGDMEGFLPSQYAAAVPSALMFR